MKQENREKKESLEQIQREKSKKRIWHYLLVYLMCLLAAFVVWLLVRYNMRTEEKADAEQVCVYELPTSDVLVL